MSGGQRLIAITLDKKTIGGGSQLLDLERTRAIADLLDANHFAPHGLEGPYALHLAVREGRLVFALTSAEAKKPHNITLALTPLRSIIRDYFIMCESYHEAVKLGGAARIEAVDMGRRALHNEGAEELITVLAGKITVDFDTARRLFTLLCVLHSK
jgi:uncharacterized protein (UPF0262 family)